MPVKLSVLVPVYNCVDYLDEALWSIRRQTFPDFQCVLVNDGSTDNSLQVLRRHALEDGRLQVLDKPNGGIVSALNQGLRTCVGEYTARMDGDDIALPDRFERQIRFLEGNPQIVMTGGWAQVIDAEGHGRVCQCTEGDGSCWCAVIRPPTDHESIDSGLASGSYTMLHPTIMARTAVMRQVGGYDPQFRIAEDLDFFLRMGESGKLANFPEIILQYRVRPKSQTMLFKASTAKWDLRALRAAQARGRRISRSTFARAEDRISWTELSNGKRRSAVKHAVRALAAAPTSPAGYKALARCVVGTFRR